MAYFKINDIDIKNPTGFSVEFYTITKSTRVASGNMVMDFVANKRKFTFSYAAITGAELNIINNVLWESLAITRQCFVKLDYLYNGEQKSATVYAGALTQKLHRAGLDPNWVWKDFEFSLIER